MPPGHWQESGYHCYAQSMEYRRIIALVVVLVSAQSFAQAYRWVDEDGVVHYSDRPSPGAEQVILQDANAVRMRTPAPRARDPEPTAPPAPTYESVSIASPAAEETLWNIGGELTVTVSVEPGLQEGHQVRLYVDGRERLFDTTTIELTEIYRGAHNLQAEIIDASGQMLARSQAIRFYVQQNSVITPP